MKTKQIILLISLFIPVVHDMNSSVGVKRRHKEVVSQEELNADLIKAASDGSLDTIKRLLEEGANIEAKNSSRQGPLHYAAWNGHEKCLKFLINKNANIEAETIYDSRPLHYAAEKGHEKCLELLLDNKAEIEAENKNGRTPLHIAAYYGHEKCVQLLLARGALTNIQTIVPIALNIS